MAAKSAITFATFEQVQQWREAGTLHALLDVRERGEYALGQIPGSCPLPRGLIEILIERLVPWQTVPIMLYSNGNHRSTLAAQTCVDMGYKNVYVLEAGINGWAKDGRSPAYGVNVIGKTFGEYLSVTNEVQQLDPDEVAKIAETGSPLILDARTPSEYAKGHIPGAFNVPGGELAQALLNAGVDQASTSPIIVHCAGRTRSIVGAYLLKQAGFSNVFAFRNGTMAWVMSGRQLEVEKRQWSIPTRAEAATEAANFARRFAADAGVESIGAAELSDLQERGEPVYAIDVRLAEEYEVGHVPSALSCPAGQLANAVDEQIAVRDALLVCYSGDETRAQIGATLLKKIGYRRVAWLREGFTGWSAAGRPTETGAAKQYLDRLTISDDGVPTVTVGEVLAQLTGGSNQVILDVRRSSEYALSHIPGSTWVPRGDLERRIGKYVTPAQPLIVVSDRHLRSTLAVRTLIGLGYRDVSRLEGGLAEWMRLGGPTVEGLEGADVSLAEAKEDAELVAPRPKLLERNREDMVRYLDWEERLGTEVLSSKRAEQ